MTIEIGLAIVFTFVCGVMYTMYRYFDDLICETHRAIDYHEENNRFALRCEKESLLTQIHILEQQLKDSAQSSSLCCKSGYDRLNSRIAVLEKRLENTVLEKKLEKPKKKLESKKD